MVKVKEDMTGWKMCEHGVDDSRLTVIRQEEDYISPNGKHYSQWLCLCSCGCSKPFVVRGHAIKNGNTKSCGCLSVENIVQIGYKNKKYNQYDIDNYEYGVGYTDKGEEFWFDKEDYELIKEHYWYYSREGYVYAYDKESDSIIALHRLVMGFPDPKLDVDHKSHPPRREHKFDNRKSNLEVVTHENNGKNRSLGINNTSGTVGVSWNKRDKAWVAYIQVNKKYTSLGYFSNKEDAIAARKEAEIKYYGKYRYNANN